MGTSSSSLTVFAADSLNVSPDVENLEAPFEKGFCFVGQVAGRSIWSCDIGLVDVDVLHGATKGLWYGNGNGFLAAPGAGVSGSEWMDLKVGVDCLDTNSVVEDKDLVL